MLALALQYSLFVFVAACGVIQVSASHAGLNGLLLFPSRRASSLFGYTLTFSALAWFFGLVNRNTRGLEGLEQTILFVPSAVCAVAATVILSSIVHQLKELRRSRSKRGARREQAHGQGFEALRERSFLDALLGERERVSQ